jgi:low temperature requirement protein LtrA
MHRLSVAGPVAFMVLICVFVVVDKSAFGLVWYFLVPTVTVLFGVGGLLGLVDRQATPAGRRVSIRLTVIFGLVGVLWVVGNKLDLAGFLFGPG